MKLTGPRLAAFLRAPDPEIRGVLFYGPDAGLVRERGEAATRAVSPDPSDPFRVTDLVPAALSGDPARLADELAALSLIGGRRVVRLREAGDAVAETVKRALAATSGDTLLVVEAGDLPPRSGLRKLFEAGKDIVAIGCYADTARDLAELVRETLAAHRITATREATAYLVENLGGDRLVTRSELEKLALYAGDGGRVDLADAVAAVGDSAALSLDDVILAAADGDAPAFERALLRCLQEGEAPITILRAAARHFQRLHLAGARVAAGASPETVVDGLRPPVFFMHKRRVAEQLRRWPPARAAAALTRLTRAELDAKRTALPQETVCREALLALVRAARG